MAEAQSWYSSHSLCLALWCAWTAKQRNTSLGGSLWSQFLPCGTPSLMSSHSPRWIRASQTRLNRAPGWTGHQAGSQRFGLLTWLVFLTAGGVSRKRGVPRKRKRSHLRCPHYLPSSVPSGIHLLQHTFAKLLRRYQNFKEMQKDFKGTKGIQKLTVTTRPGRSLIISRDISNGKPPGTVLK